MVYLTKYYRVLDIAPYTKDTSEFIRSILKEDVLEIVDDLLSGDCMMAHRFRIKNMRTGEFVFIINSLDQYLSLITYEHLYGWN